MVLELLATALVLAGLQATTPPVAPTPATAPVVVPPEHSSHAPPVATIEVPSSDTQSGHWAAIWPPQAYQAHISGHVILACHVDRFGIAEACVVASETPKGWGFGQAALAMRPTLKVSLPAAGVEPTGALMNIAINFSAPNPDTLASGFSGQNVTYFSQIMLSEKQPITLLNNPVWSKAPTFDDWKRAYPAAAKGGAGYAVAHCAVRPDGRLTQCEVVKVTPEKGGFERAALALAGMFQVAPQWAVAPNHGQLWLDIPIRFPSPTDADDRTVANPYWIGGFDPDQELKVFPPEAAAKQVTSGHGVAQCRVTEDGSLADCKPYAADPEGLGFDVAAVTLAATMHMNPWTADGGPVDGDTALVGIQLNLRGAGGAPAPAAHLAAPSVTPAPAAVQPPADAAAALSLDGTWRGEVSDESGPRGLVLHIKTNAKGGTVASVDAPERRALDLTVIHFHRDGQQVVFVLAATGASYVGTVDASGSTISGVWTHNRQQAPTVFVRDPH